MNRLSCCQAAAATSLLLRSICRTGSLSLCAGEQAIAQLCRASRQPYAALRATGGGATACAGAVDRGQGRVSARKAHQ